MNLVPDSLAFGLIFLFGAAGIVLAMMPGRHKFAELLVSYLFTFFTGVPVAGLDVAVPWSAFSELCLAICALSLVAAVGRYARRELAEGEYD